MDLEEDRIAALFGAGASDDEISRRLGVSFLEILGRRGEAASAPAKIVPLLRPPRPDGGRGAPGPANEA